jgi:hypothetical protein
MTNEQFKSLKKVFNFVKPGIKSIGDSSFATILTLLSEYDIDYKHFVVVDNKYVSFMLNDLSKLTLKNGKKGFILTWTNKPRLVKQVMPETSNSTVTSSVKEMMLVDYLKAGYKLEDVREVKIVEGMYSAGVTSDYVGNSYKSSLVEVNTMTFDLVDVSPAVVNADFFIDEILVTDWIESPPTGAGQSNKFIPLTEWLQSKSPIDISKARVKGTPTFSDNVYLLTNDKCFLDDKINKYHINQIEVR